ncbi:hypothetical protein M422DRAFT_257931 [Sphaerobolus stellatus SS14]|uniref:Tuberous sclerosis 1 protein homolog n=1 Tax=Sphaerobolus stellatus (strain SS14) TaxID=990650 RepID=A0A0C9U8F4_SPHS4|nr:hypothetical protein M422DRAFT_257931 [Sphaerobolus stellatus SS14]
MAKTWLKSKLKWKRESLSRPSSPSPDSSSSPLSQQPVPHDWSRMLTPAPAAMSITADLSRRIRAVLASDNPASKSPDLFAAIAAFVATDEAHDVLHLHQLRDELETLYGDVVDHSSAAKVEGFVAILHAFLPVSRPLYVITHWWDLVLRAALRDWRLSPLAVNQAKELALLGFTEDSAKGAEFRKRVVELYLLDAYDEHSGEDALEQAKYPQEERKGLQFWKDNLRDILERLCLRQPQEFFDTLNIFFVSSQPRLKLVLLLSSIIPLAQFPIQKFASHPLLNALLTSLIVDGSSTLFRVEIHMLTILLPQFAIHAPETLVKVLPSCYAILGRVICWRPRENKSESIPPPGPGGEVSISQSSGQSRLTDPELDPAATPAIRSDLGFERLDATFLPFVPDPPSPMPLFNTLYGLFPCNTVSFLSDPSGYLTRLNLQSPFKEDWTTIVDDDQIKTRTRVIFRHNILHTSLITNTALSEVTDLERWKGWDVPRITTMCTMLDARNSALSLRRMSGSMGVPGPEAPHMPLSNTGPDADGDGDVEVETPRAEGWPVGSPFGPGPTLSGGDQGKFLELHCTQLSAGQRPRVSVQDILATYHVLRAGIDIDIVDPPPEWPIFLAPPSILSAESEASAGMGLRVVSPPPVPSHSATASTKTAATKTTSASEKGSPVPTPRPGPSTRSSSSSSSAPIPVPPPTNPPTNPPSPIPPSASEDTPLPPHVLEVIARLQKDNLLLRSELNYELWLKRENVKRTGTLYVDKIMVKGAEVERQGLHNKLREYKAQVHRLQQALSKEQAGAATNKAQHADFARRLQNRLKADKAEKQKWAEEKSKLESNHENAQAMFEAQSTRLADAMETVFKLETEIKEYSPKVQRLRDYEEKIEQLMRAQRLWDNDIAKIKEQQYYIEGLQSRYRKKLEYIQSLESANQEMQRTIHSLNHRLATLTTPPPRPKLFPVEISESTTSGGTTTISRPRPIQAMMEQLRKEVIKLTEERDSLRAKNGTLEDRLEELSCQMEELKGQGGMGESVGSDKTEVGRG